LDALYAEYDQTVYLNLVDESTGLTQTLASNTVHPYFVKGAVGDLTKAKPTAVAYRPDLHAMPVYQGPIENGRWVAAADLAEGDRLLAADSNWLRVESVEQVDKPLTAYNIDVANTDNYFVRGTNRSEASAVWVHNCDGPRAGRDAKGRFTGESGGNTATAERGREAHKEYRNTLGGDYQFEVTLPGGKRADAVDFKNRIVRELKPDNPRTISDARRQVESYRKELEAEFGGTWTSEIDIYRP
jgi:hypothetical protein